MPTKKSKIILLFLCGFLAGICLEILLIERRKPTVLPLQESLQEGLRITCLVLLKHRHVRYVTSAKRTWLKHCNNYTIVNVRKSSKNFENPKSKRPMNFSATEEFNGLIKNYSICSENDDVQEILAKNAWGGLCKAFHLIKHIRLHWLVIIPDSLMVLIENLKLFVNNSNHEESHYFGYAVKNYQADFNVLSAGILLSRGTLNKLLNKFSTAEDCDFSGKYWRNEDFYLGKHLKQLDIFPRDTRDEEGRGRFHGYNVNSVLWPGKLFKQSDYCKKALYPVPQGFNCCSPFLITLDVSNPDSMRDLYFSLYKLKTVNNQAQKEGEVKKTDDTYWKDFLREEGYSEREIEKMTSEEYYNIWEKKLPQNKIYKEMQEFIKNRKQSMT